ncbi:TIM barrel protein [Xylophilus rhododendri]|uniref:TIM barrel protein n=1 Tax=Xylophilus rhododendri TaxID=2697032 RepID=A0A857J083_9BURK|nr:2-oxo-tetronate isomerase [Xylophilus rhododendri]QHI96599.1 TIM barrel protein [Xylophilus rhododendri]
MPRFAANLSFLYQELAFLDRFEAAARDGFQAVEYLAPYPFEPAEIRSRLKANGLQQVLFNAPPSGGEAADVATAWDRSERGIAALPGREAEFRQGFAHALRYAEALDCPRIHVMAGLAPTGADRNTLRTTYIANLRWAAAEAAKAGREVLIEPINTRDIPGFFLNRQDDAHAVLAEVGAANLKVQMDLYHCQIVEGDVASKLKAYLPTGRVGHLQIAGVPERHEPDTGELNYGYLFEVIDSLGFDGWIGCEYKPRRGAVPGGTSDGLGWLRGLHS